MPEARTSPGVHIDEITNGVQTIEGVGTSMAAFVGRTLQGPSQEPWSLGGYAEFESDFGQQDGSNALARAVGDFFLNGTNQHRSGLGQ